MPALDLTPRHSRPLKTSDLTFRSNRTAVGFESSTREEQQRPLRVDGEIPPWLRGRLIRTGPALFEVGDEAYRHWFDGLAKLYAFHVRESGVEMTSRFLASQSYLTAERKRDVEIAEFGTEPHRGPVEAARALILGPKTLTDNCNVNVNRWGEHFVAMTETPQVLRFDPTTLETLGPFEFADDVDGTLSTAHPHYDPKRNLLFSYVTVIGRRSSYIVYSMAPNTNRRVRLAEIEVARPAYMHSFGASEDHLVLVEFPLRLLPLELRFTLSSFRQSFRWRPEEGTRITILSKESGQVIARHRTDPMFAFHHINAYADGDAIVVDLVAYDDARVIDDFSLERLRGRSPPSATGRIERLRIPLRSEAAAGTLRTEPLSNLPVELPRIDPRAATHRHRYVYAAVNTDPATFLDGVAKIDVENGSSKLWQEDLHVNEAVFVPRPGANGGEDDGVLLVVALDADQEKSLLVMLDAATMTERARAHIDHVIPFHFHGAFFPD